MKRFSMACATALTEVFCCFFSHKKAFLAFLALCSPAHADTLYQALGGTPGITRITDGVIGRCMTDPRLHAYFDNINPDWLKPHFVTFLCHVTDGGCDYHRRSMRAVHRGLHIDEAAFNAVVEDLQAALRDAGVAFWTQNRLLARLAPMERDIVTR